VLDKKGTGLPSKSIMGFQEGRWRGGNARAHPKNAFKRSAVGIRGDRLTMPKSSRSERDKDHREGRDVDIRSLGGANVSKKISGSNHPTSEKTQKDIIFIWNYLRLGEGGIRGGRKETV